MNPYDPCVWNKIMNGKQLTIVFHVDDCKLSHVDSKIPSNGYVEIMKVYSRTVAAR